MKLKDKIAIVTGAGKGIGEGIARVFAREGAKVVVAEIKADLGTQTVAGIEADGGTALFVETDVTSGDSIRNMIDKTAEAFGQIDVLVNNAGYHLSKNVEQTSEQEWEFLINTNLRSAFLCCKHAIPHLRKTKGSIVNIASMVGLVGQPNAGAYSASKGGMIAMTRGMALDFAKDGIRANAICPGWVQTPLVEDWFGQQEDEAAMRKYVFDKHPLGRIATAEECGKAALFLACGDDSGSITGITLNVEGGITLGY